MKKSLSILFFLCVNIALNAQWKYANYPSGGWIQSITTHQNFVFASVSGEVFVSSDKGDHWNTSGNGLPSSDVVFLCATDNKVFAGTRKGIYASSDNGASWSPSGTGLPDSVNHRISYLAGKGSVILAGAPPGHIYRSADEGATWKRVYDQTLYGVVKPIVIKNNLVVAGVFNGLIYSRDLGLSWTIAPGLVATQPVFTMPETSIVADFLEDIYISPDSGSTWNYQLNDLPAQTLGTVMENEDSVLYLGTDKGLLTSRDGGSTWLEELSGLPYRSYVNAFAWLNDGLFMGTSKNIFYSNDHGRNWTAKSKDINRIQVNALISSGNTILSGCGSGMINSGDNAATWEYKIFGVNGNGHVLYYTALDTLLFAATENYVFSSSDKGETWDEKYSGMALSDAYTTQVKANAGVLYATKMTDGIYRSTNKGDSWVSVNGNLPTGETVISVGFHNNTLFIGTEEHGVYRSVNAGVKWTLTNNGLPSALKVNEISTFGDVIMLATDKGMFKSADDGLNWSAMNDVPEQEINCISKVDNYILAGTWGDVFLSENQGLSWRSVKHGLPDAKVNAFILHNTMVYAGTDQGVWYCALKDVGIKETTKLMDVQIYPNPTNGGFQISSDVQLKQVEVYNGLGKKVWTTATNAFSAQLDISHLAKGLYFIKVIARDGNSITQKLLSH
jgi:photosystem II stability/assembly factor-like uncharacterized protein